MPMPMSMPPPINGSVRGNGISRGYDGVRGTYSPPPSRRTNGHGRYRYDIRE